MSREWQRQLLIDFEEYIKARRTDFADEVREAEAFADEVGVQPTSAVNGADGLVLSYGDIRVHLAYSDHPMLAYEPSDAYGNSPWSAEGDLKKLARLLRERLMKRGLSVAQTPPKAEPSRLQKPKRPRAKKRKRSLKAGPDVGKKCLA